MKQFECTLCSKIFNHNKNLRKHVSISHPEENIDLIAPTLTSQKTFILECELCQKHFKSDSQLKHHVKKQHTGYTCAFCFQDAKNMKEHLWTDHQVIEEHLEFNSRDDFLEWKLEIEKDTLTKFAKETTYRGSQTTTEYYKCHRNGIFHSKSTGKRPLRSQSSCKIGKPCPANIKLTIDAQGKFCVDYVQTHIGHEYRPDESLKHLHIIKLEEEKIATYIANEDLVDSNCDKFRPADLIPSEITSDEKESKRDIILYPVNEKAFDESCTLDEEKQLISVEKELSHVNKEIKRLTERRNWLIKLKDKLQDEILLKKSNTHCTDDWNKDGVPKANITNQFLNCENIGSGDHGFITHIYKNKNLMASCHNSDVSKFTTRNSCKNNDNQLSNNRTVLSQTIANDIVNALKNGLKEQSNLSDVYVDKDFGEEVKILNVHFSSETKKSNLDVPLTCKKSQSCFQEKEILEKSKTNMVDFKQNKASSLESSSLDLMKINEEFKRLRENYGNKAKTSYPAQNRNKISLIERKEPSMSIIIDRNAECLLNTDKQHSFLNKLEYNESNDYLSKQPYERKYLTYEKNKANEEKRKNHLVPTVRTKDDVDEQKVLYCIFDRRNEMKNDDSSSWEDFEDDLDNNNIIKNQLDIKISENGMKSGMHSENSRLTKKCGRIEIKDESSKRKNKFYNKKEINNKTRKNDKYSDKSCKAENMKSSQIFVRNTIELNKIKSKNFPFATKGSNERIIQWLNNGDEKEQNNKSFRPISETCEILFSPAVVKTKRTNIKAESSTLKNVNDTQQVTKKWNDHTARLFSIESLQALRNVLDSTSEVTLSDNFLLKDETGGDVNCVLALEKKERNHRLNHTFQAESIPKLQDMCHKDATKNIMNRTTQTVDRKESDENQYTLLSFVKSPSVEARAFADQNSVLRMNKDSNPAATEVPQCVYPNQTELLQSINKYISDGQSKDSPTLARAQDQFTRARCRRRRNFNTSLKKRSSTSVFHRTPDFAWSSKVYTVLKNKFKLAEFRTNQLAAINVTLLKKDAIVIMPTGSGKSLCYQLPALLDQGITVVISPMISLMEDQIGQLRRLNISAEMLQASNTREENGRVMKLMADKSSLKLLYVSPEKLAKSKTFMTKLQKMYKAGAVARFAIDEVHCCSTWGHDFRPDYQYLSILKTMFPEIPILGLTATATTKVMLDVQKMLQIEGCVVLKAPFNRPNLFYEVRVKPAAQKDCMDELEGLLKNRFRNESGIIYTTSIKECEELRDALRARGLRVSAYHAKLESDMRSKVHTKWLSGEYQAVVATIAFGLGIDKPNVRFVIHHCLSKSMENFYQESGRAGRDGKTAYCILYYRLSDVLKLSPMVFDQQTGLPNLYNIVSYCLEPSKCRRSIIASYFDEPWSDVDCNSMCDHCSQPAEAKEVDITKHARTLCTILEHVADKDVSVTAAMLLDLWYRQKVAKVKDVPGMPSLGPPSFPRITGENIIAHLLIKLYLKQDFHFTPYSTISYLKVGPKGSSLLHDSEHTITMTIPAKLDAGAAAGRDSDKKKSPKNTARKTKSKAKEDGPKRKNAKTRSDKVGGAKDTCKDAVRRKRSLDLNDLVEVVSESSDKEDIDFKCVKSKVSEPRSDKVDSPKKDRLSKDAVVRPSLDDYDTHDDRVELVSDSEDVDVKRRKTDVESNPDDGSGVSKVTLLLVNPSDISEVSTVIDLNSDDECT